MYLKEKQMKDNLGLGVIIRMLSNNKEAVDAYKKSLNKTIIKINLEDNKLKLSFNDDTELIIWDGGQSCCEDRYMVCDDDVKPYIGGKLKDIEILDAPNEEDEYGEHEVQFLKIITSKGWFKLSNHNEHNGYYGGFYIELRLNERKKK
jgi:hypothetical protein